MQGAVLGCGRRLAPSGRRLQHPLLLLPLALPLLLLPLLPASALQQPQLHRPAGMLPSPSANASAVPQQAARPVVGRAATQIWGAPATLPAEDQAAKQPAAAAMGQIPKVIHQSWKTWEVPEQFAIYVASWRRFHPTWRHVLWSDADNRALIAARFPWFIPTYDALPHPVMRADATRYAYMHAFGGVYVDLDIECLKPLDSLLFGILATKPAATPPAVVHNPNAPPAAAVPVATAPKRRQTAAAAVGRSTVLPDCPPVRGLQSRSTAVVALLSPDLPFVHNIPNAFLASTPGHGLWLEVLREIEGVVRGLGPEGLEAAATGGGKSGGGSAGPLIEEITGPVLLKAVIARHMGRTDYNTTTTVPSAATSPEPSRAPPPASSPAFLVNKNTKPRHTKRRHRLKPLLAPSPTALDAIRAAALTPVPPSPLQLPLRPSTTIAATTTTSVETNHGCPDAPAAAATPANAATPGSVSPPGDVFVIPPGVIFPFDWHKGRPDFGSGPDTFEARRVRTACSAWSNAVFDRERCQRLVVGPGTHAITYWAHSWAKRRPPWYEHPFALPAAFFGIAATTAAAAAAVWQLGAHRGRPAAVAMHRLGRVRLRHF